jgi:hypothetical protein
MLLDARHQCAASVAGALSTAGFDCTYFLSHQPLMHCRHLLSLLLLLPLVQLLLGCCCIVTFICHAISLCSRRSSMVRLPVAVSGNNICCCGCGRHALAPAEAPAKSMQRLLNGGIHYIATSSQLLLLLLLLYCQLLPYCQLSFCR